MTTMSPIRGGVLHLPTSHEGRYSQSLERGLAILRAFTPERTWMGIAEIADTLQMSRPTTHRYASTLVALGYLEQGPGRKYRLGMRAGDPGRAAVNSTVLRKLSRQCLTDLRDRSTCTASLAVLDGIDIVYIDRARSSWQGQSEISTRLGRGSRVPAQATAMGRTLLAYLAHGPTEKDYEGVIIEQSPASELVAEDGKLLAELGRIRAKGFALADQVQVEGQRCLAAPVRSRSGDVVAAVDVAAPKSRFSRVQISEQLLPLVLESAEEMSTRLGYTR
jgi:IclR family transcriptional regulator, pca regulon regulatory protein